MTGSRAMAGRLAPEVLALKDAEGVSIGEALKDFRLRPGAASRGAGEKRVRFCRNAY